MLAQQLSRQISGDDPEGAVHIRLSFRSNDGVCRLFSLHGGMTGFACRDQDEWKIHSLMAAETAPDTQYRLASHDIPPALMAQIDEIMEGETFSRQTELAAREAGWRR